MYVLILEDRHTDVGVRIFTDREKAVGEAKKMAVEYAHREEDLEEEEISGWLYYCRYSCEGDCVSVREVEVE